ncbi:MAG TPA: hypothetical protein VLX92_31930, partial [Kofleriaceae bacterium]|nr:hypothetical protein [Kofleriaceae bacterium]
MAKRFLVALAAPIAATGCQSSTDLPTAPPKTVTMVAQGGFTSPSDAVASPNGKDFYFAAYDANLLPAIFHTSSSPGGAIDELAMDDPLEAPIGLVMSCDGKTIYVADLGGDSGAVLSVSTGGGGANDLGATGIVRPGGLAMGPDCKTLYMTGLTDDGTFTPALFTMPVTGGGATIVYSGAPLVSPTGLHVDDQGVA